jgi:cystathionine beta-synthase
VHVALEVARELGKGKVVAVVLTDTGNNYITKFFNDEWMKDNGFAVDDKSPGRVKDLIRARKQEVLFASKGQRIDAVVEQMRKHGISQMPVRDPHGGTVGMIHEYDLLNALVSKKQGFHDVIDALIAPLQGVVSPEATLSRLREVFAQDNVAVVKEHEQVVGIVTKIDLIEYLAERM